MDNTTGRFSESYLRKRPKDLTQCGACHKGEPGDREYPMLAGIDMNGVRRYDPAMDWDFVDRIRNYWKGKFIIKGVDTREDAQLCLQHGMDGMLVSNHGGRSTETGRATIEALPEVVAEVRGRIPVFVDGGVRRGTDELALAHAVHLALHQLIDERRNLGVAAGALQRAQLEAQRGGVRARLLAQRA